jgi:hypothetical protein
MGKQQRRQPVASRFGCSWGSSRWCDRHLPWVVDELESSMNQPKRAR